MGSRYRDEGDALDEEESNRRLQQAISYLSAHGGQDSFPLYKERVNTINDLILHDYVEEGRRFDPEMYRQLRDMVDTQLDAFDREEGARGSLGDSYSEESEDVHMSDALYREDISGPESDPGEGSSRRPPRRYSEPPRPQTRGYRGPREKVPAVQSQRPPPRVKPAKDEHPGAISWYYGGPKNTKEIWKRQYPSMLPFGETLAMREFESQKISYDLMMGPQADPIDAAAKNPVKFDDALDKVLKKSPYDTGSRIKLLSSPDIRMDVETATDYKLLYDAVQEFNNGGGYNLQVKKNYVPRLFLDYINMPRVVRGRRRSSGSGPGPSPIGRRASTPPSAARGTQFTARSAASSAKTPPRPVGRPPLTPGRSQSRGRPAGRVTQVPVTPPRRIIEVRPSPPPMPKRPRGRPPKNRTADSLSPLLRKRKLSDAQDSYDEAHSSAAKRGKQGGKRVAFQDPNSPPGRPVNRKLSFTPRGQTRSGLKFKK